MTQIKYCPHCNQNVNVITKPTTGALALCFIGFPFLVGADSLNKPMRVVNPKTALATVVILVVFFQVLVAIGWIIGIIALLLRRSYCPICRTPGKMLQAQK